MFEIKGKEFYLNGKKFNKKILDNLLEKYNICKEKIYIMGVSLGGNFVWQALHQYPNYFACAIPIASRYMALDYKSNIDFSKFKYK